MAEMIKPSKILSQAEIDSIYSASQKLMYPEEIFAARRTYADNLEGINKKYRLLAKIINDNNTADIAQRCGAKDYQDFLKVVPLTSYDDYAPLIAHHDESYDLVIRNYAFSELQVAFRICTSAKLFSSQSAGTSRIIL